MAMGARAQHSARSVRLSIQPPHFSSNITSLLLLLKPVSRWGPGTGPHLDFASSGLSVGTTFSYFTWRAAQMEICLTVYRFWRGKSPICKNNLQWHMFGRIVSHTLHDECDGNLERFLARGIRSHFSRSEITPATSGEHEWTEWHFASWKR